MPKRHVSQWLVLLGFFAIVICAATVWVVRILRGPDVTVTEFGYIESNGMPVFTLHNKSAHAALFSDRCWLVSVSKTGRTNRDVINLMGGAMLPAGALKQVTIPAVPTQAVWSVEFEVLPEGIARSVPLLSSHRRIISSSWIRNARTNR